MKILLFLLFIIKFVFSQDSGTNLAEDEEKTYPTDVTSLHCDNTKLSDFKVGDHVFVCVHLVPREYRMAFNVTVDNYEVLSVNGAFIFVDKDTQLYDDFIFQFGNITTPYRSRYYFKGATKELSTLFNVVIKLDKGKIVDVVWDNDCWSCGFDGGCKTWDNIKSLRNSSEFYSENVSHNLIRTVLNKKYAM